jgi:predicted RNase H-like HicB family nuclease
MQTKRLRGTKHPKQREFVVVIERDEDGWYVASVPTLNGCHTQARSLDELTGRIKEAILLCLDTTGEKETLPTLEFVGLQKVTV